MTEAVHLRLRVVVTGHPLCPHCGREDPDTFEDGDVCEIVCGFCHRTFWLCVNTAPDVYHKPS